MRIQKASFRTGIILAAITIILFLLVNIFLKDTRFVDLYPFQYYKTTLIVNSFGLTVMYALMAFRLLTVMNRGHYHTFLENFRNAFAALFIGGAFSMLFIYWYLNYFDPVSIEILKEQQVDLMLSFGQTAAERQEMKENMQLDQYNDVNTFSFQLLFGLYFPVIIVYYLMISFILSMFFKK